MFKNFKMTSKHDIRVCIGHQETINVCRYSSCGNYIMTASSDRTIKLWNPSKDDINNPKSALLIKSYGDAHSYPIYDLAITPDNSKFVSGGSDRTCFLHDISTGNIIRRINAHLQKTNALSLNADGTVLLTGSDDKTLKAWDLRSNMRDPIQIMDQFKDAVTCIDQVSDQFVTGSIDGSIRLFDLRAGHMHQDYLQKPVTCVRYSSNHKSILATCLSGYLRLLNIETGSLLNQYHGGHTHEKYKNEAVFSYDNNHIICGSESSCSVSIYDFLSTKHIENIVLSPRGGSIITIDRHPQKGQVIAAGTDANCYCVSL